MILYNCKITIEPKDRPEMNVTFWDGEVTLPDFFEFDGSKIKDGPFHLPIDIKLYPDPSKDASIFCGICGDLTESQKPDSGSVFKKGQPLEINGELVTVAEDVFGESGSMTVKRWLK